MNEGAFTESIVEQATLAWLESLDYRVYAGAEISPNGETPERSDYSDVVLRERLRTSLVRINPLLPPEAIEEAIRRVMHLDGAGIVDNNRRFHRYLVAGVDVQFKRPDGSDSFEKAWLLDYATPSNNDWLAVNQFTIKEGMNQLRRTDVLIFINGLPLVLIELKNAADEDATARDAYHQIQTYQTDIPSLFHYNAFCVVSDGLEARAGTFTSDWERFAPWRTTDGRDIAPKGVSELDTLLKGMFEPIRLLDLVRHFLVFEDDSQGRIVKKLAAYHQYYAVNKAIENTVRASMIEGDRRIGVIWHTQGSGKSLSMVFYAGKIIVQAEMANPTVVVLTDRNDLDQQLFGTFSNCRELLRQTPEQAESRDDLRAKLTRASGGVVFTTIQKFMADEKGARYQTLSERRNIVVIADEAHRSQYDFVDGLARNLHDGLPQASFIGFTGTPIEADDRSTPAVFGNYIDVYDIERAVEDGATVRIYYEGRLARLTLRQDERPTLDAEFEEATEGEEVERKEKLKTKWAAQEALVGSEKRLELVAKDLVEHFDRRCEVLDGKGMIVCMSRRICVALHDAIARLRPDWIHPDDDQGTIKIVMTGAADDPPEFQPHIRNKARRESLAKRLKDPDDPLRLVIVRDMWLTGFDAPCLHTMYADKPMRGHGLMQAIARVNRVFKDKPGGLIVDYLGLADQLKSALRDYTVSGGKGRPTFDQADAVKVLMIKYEVCCDLFHGFDYSNWTDGSAIEKLTLLPAAQEHILKQDQGKERFISAVGQLSKAFALAVPDVEALSIRDEVAFFQAVRAALAKTTIEGAKTQDDMDSAIRQLVSRAVIADGVIDLYAAAGLKNPDISILSDEFLAEMRGLPQRNLAFEVLKKLLNEQVKIRARKNVVQARSFAEMLERTIRLYQNRAIEAAEVIQNLIELARQMRDADRRGEKLGLNTDEIAFYDALEVNDSAVKILGDENLQIIARELVQAVRQNVSIDWTVKAGVQAKLRVLVKRILRKYGYPPDKQERATQVVLQQAEVLCAHWQ